MNSIAKHHVRRLVWRLKGQSHEDAAAWWQALRSDVGEVVLSTLAELLDQHADPNRVVYLGCLHLDVKCEDPEDLPRAVAAQLAMRLEEVMATQVGGATQGRTGGGTARDAPGGADVQQASLVEDRRQALLTYLSYGTASPAHAARVGLNDFRTEAAACLAGGVLPPGLPPGRDPAFRWLSLSPEADRGAALHLLTPDTERQPLLKSLAEHLTSTGLPQDTALQVLAAAVQQTMPLTRIRDLVDDLEAAAADAVGQAGQTPVVLSTGFLVDDLNTADTAAQIKHPKLPTQPSSIESAWQPADLDCPSGLRVAGAGVILLHPYLVRLFEARGIQLGSEAAKEDRRRAFAILQYLAFGPPEHNLGLPLHESCEFTSGLFKVLTGLEPSDSLPVATDLLEAADHAEADALLSAVIGHWNRLGNTSPSTFRRSFLDRSGILRDTKSHWELQIESETVDVLLSSTPWSISLIRQPWMPRPIYVNWTAP